MTPQAPAAARIGFIGAGRVGTALAVAFGRAGLAVTAVASRRHEAAHKVAKAVPGCRAYRDVQDVADHADLVFLTIPDDAIASVAGEISWQGVRAVVHCSGATSIDALAPAAQAGAQIGGFHPLQVFSDTEAALAGIPRSVVAIAADEPLATELRGLARTLGARPIELPDDARALYHAAGSFAAAFVVTLLHEAARIWGAWGRDEADALAALVPLAHGALDAVARAGTVAGLTGPIVRGDFGTVEKHVRALGAHDPAILDLYRVLALRTVEIALARGTITAAQAEMLRGILSRAP